jgi:hypothetical protein
VKFASPAAALSAGGVMDAKYVEGLLLFVVAGLTDREASIQLKEQLQGVDSKLLDVIKV